VPLVFMIEMVAQLPLLSLNRHWIARPWVVVAVCITRLVVPLPETTDHPAVVRADWMPEIMSVLVEPSKVVLTLVPRAYWMAMTYSSQFTDTSKLADGPETMTMPMP
jgi:hypothetical protein